MKKIVLLIIVLFLCSCKHDVNLKITDETNNTVSKADVWVTKQDIPAINKYIDIYGAEIGETPHILDYDQYPDTTEYDPNDFYRSITKFLGENKLNKAYIALLDEVIYTKWIVADKTDESGLISFKIRSGEYNLLIEKDGYICTYGFNVSGDETKVFEAKTK